jgi:transposase-like protein
MKNEVQPLSSSALLGAGRSEAERSETERSAAPSKAGADTAAVVRPDPEVVAKAKRRRFTAKYKQQILAKADAAASDPGAIGALLRREGLYSSHLVVWRRQREASIRQGLEPQKRGPKSRRNPMAEENQKLQRENDRLTEQLRKAELIIDVQKNSRAR